MVQNYTIRLLTVLIAAMTVAGMLLGTHSTQAQTNSPVWALVDSGPNHEVDFHGVFMVNGTVGAWAVGGEGPMGSEGTGGVAVRFAWNGQRWAQQLRDTFPTPLRAIAVVSESNIWAVGDRGLIVHRVNLEDDWQTVAQPAGNNINLSAIQMFGNGEEGWAVGYRRNTNPPEPIDNPTVLLHYQNSVWHEDSSITGNLPQQDIHFGGGGGYTVGYSAAWRYDQNGWHAETLPCRRTAFGCSTELHSVRTLNSGEAWAVGKNQPHGPSTGNFSQPLILHRVAGVWQDVLQDQPLLNDPFANGTQGGLQSISFSSDGFGIAVGYQKRTNELTCCRGPLVVSYRADGRWHYEEAPYVAGGGLTAVSQVDGTHALAVGDRGLVMSYGYGGPTPPPWPTSTPAPSPQPTAQAGGLPTSRVPDPQLPNVRYFPQTGHSLQGGFRVYWEAHGGLAQFGYPLTEEFHEPDEVRGIAPQVQYFERARFEYHPENRPPYDVLLGLLGSTSTAGRRNEPAFCPVAAQTGPGTLFFAPTGHNMPPQFAGYWQTHGGLPVYGYPISEAFQETSPTDGKPYLVQYFERNRLEYHPELPEPYRVSLGLLGTETLRGYGWLP